MSLCMSSAQKWIEAATHNDLPTIRKMIDANNSTRDQRKTLKDESIFNDFTALLYAALFDYSDIAQLLIPFEHHLPTTETLSLACKGITANRNFIKEIPAGTSPFQLAILCNSKRTVRLFFNYFTNKNIDIPASQNPMIELSLCRYFDVSLLTSEFVEKNFTGEALRNACIYGRYPELEQILALETTPQKIALFKALMQRSSGGQTPQELCAVAVDYSTLEVNKNEKSQCLKAIEEISKRAVETLEQMGKSEQYVVEDFLKCYQPSEIE